MPILYSVETNDPYPAPVRPEAPVRLWALGERLIWLSGLILLLSTLMGWYVGSGEGLTISVIGWHTGALGKLVFFIGLAVLALVALRQAGIELSTGIHHQPVECSLPEAGLARVSWREARRAFRGTLRKRKRG